MFSKCKETRERRVTKRDIKVIVTGRGEKPRECFFFFFQQFKESLVREILKVSEKY